jgi:predicted Rossmann fold flavoprotein
MLLAEAAGVDLHLHTAVASVTQSGTGFLVQTTPAQTAPAAPTRALHAQKVIVATGGLSIPKIGATAIGYSIARGFGHRIVEPRPALVPLVFHGEDARRFEGLSGVSTDVSIALDGRLAEATFRDKLLFTHRGISGPAVLQISSYWRPGSALSIDLAPDLSVTDSITLASARRDMRAAGEAWSAALPRRLADRLLTIAPPRSWHNDSLAEAERQLHAWPLTPAGTEGYEKAEVTAGGVDTAELSAKSMESRRIPGLYFIGEVVDVTGHLGGYNFQWAWASAAAAASGI